MSRKSSSNKSSNGCLVALFPLLLVLGAIGTVLEFVAENIGVILIVVAVVGAIIGIVVAVNSAAKKKEQEEAERQKNLAIVNASEPRPALKSIPTSTIFASKEEEHVNVSFREFLRKNNDVIAAQSHLDYLTNKASALRALGRNDEAAQLDSDINQAKTVLSSSQSKRGGVFESKFNNLLYRTPDIKSAFSTFATKLPNERLPLIGDFFMSPQIKIVKAGTDTTALLFTPSYVMHYSGPSSNIKIIEYKDVRVSSWVTTEILHGQRQPNDEIEHIGYAYETKDGRRDMRYSYENNPSYTFVYRGTATIRCNGLTYEQKFSNKTLTESFEKAMKEYLSLLSGKYKKSISQILEHNEEVLSAGDIDTYLAQQAAADRIREAAEKAERDKKEKERLEREAKAEAKRQKEQAEREAAEREKQKRKDFLNSLSIVDGTLTSWYGNDRNFVLPAGIVTSIGTAFRWKSNLETVELPEGITSIQANAFHGSTSLRKVTIPSSVCEIGKEAFLGCTALSEITLPTGIKSISSQMFGKCSSLKSISLPVGIKHIDNGAFSGCGKLQELVLPEGVTDVGDDAFENCFALKKVILPNSVTKIGKNIFAGCASLEHVVIGSGIKKIPDACFNNQQKLVDVTVSSELVEIGDRAFKNCQKLTHIIYDDSNKSVMSKGMDFEALVSGRSNQITNAFSLDALERIGKSAFENCYAFEGLMFSSGLRTLDDYAFANCRAIKAISIPKTLKLFGTGVFLGCSALANVDGIDNVDWHKKNSFIGTPWLSTQAENGFVLFDGYLEAYTGTDASVVVPQGIKIIGKNAFDGNAFVTSVNILDGVSVIEELAFANCRRLKSVQIPDSVAHIEDNAFANDTGFIIQCSRGSVASSYRIRNKIAGEYIAKTKPIEASSKASSRRTSSSVSDGLSGLSEDELRVIMEMRREKLAQKKAEAEKPVEPEKTEYDIVSFDTSKVSITLQPDNRKITNNIFNLKFLQNEPVSSMKASAEFEAFVIDKNGQIISGVKNIVADKSGDDLTHKVSFSLSAQEKFDKASAYYVVVRYKGAGTSILSKTQYQINIEFASDFDF